MTPQLQSGRKRSLIRTPRIRREYTGMYCVFDYTPKIDVRSDCEEIERLFVSIARSGEAVTLLNYFNEIPVISSTPVLVLDNGRIEVMPNDAYLTVLSREMQTFIMLPGGESLVADCHEVSLDRKFAILTEFRFITIYANRREAIRVSFDIPISAALEFDHRAVAASLLNLSLSGARIMTRDADVKVGRKGLLRFNNVNNMTRQVETFEIYAAIVKIENDTPPFICGLRFDLDQIKESELALFINRRQVDIIKQIREMREEI